MGGGRGGLGEAEGGPVGGWQGAVGASRERLRRLLLHAHLLDPLPVSQALPSLIPSYDPVQSALSRCTDVHRPPSGFTPSNLSIRSHPVSTLHTPSHPPPPGLTRSRPLSLGLTRSHSVSPSLTRSHPECHPVSPSLTRSTTGPAVHNRSR